MVYWKFLEQISSRSDGVKKRQTSTTNPIQQPSSYSEKSKGISNFLSDEVKKLLPVPSIFNGSNRDSHLGDFTSDNNASSGGEDSLNLENDVSRQSSTLASPSSLVEESTPATSCSSHRSSVNTVQKIRSPIDTVPIEILRMIIQYLDTDLTALFNCLFVCRKWSQIAVSCLWLRIAISDIDQFQRLINTIWGSRDMAFYPYQKYLKRLNLSALGSKVSSAKLLAFINCRNMERLTLAGCSEVTDHALELICGANKNLVAVDLGCLPLITGATLDALTRSNPNLQGINLHYSCHIDEEAFIKMAIRCKQLRRIRLSAVPEITDDVVISIAENCPNLLELDLEHCTEVTDISIRKILEKCSELRELRLGHCRNISDAAFTHLKAGQLSSLRHLDLTNCYKISDDTVAAIARATVKLKNLVLAKCIRITDNGLMSLVQLSRVLHFLHLAHCEYITDRSIMTIAHYCTRLRYIDVACCYQLTDESMLYLAKLPKLRRVGLVKCSRITDTSILAFARNCGATLERAHLSYCTNISLYAVHTLLNSCKNLNHVSVTGIHAFLRPDLQKFCRPVPDEFTASQKAIFCVFSGNGVKRLNEYLLNLRQNELDRVFEDQQRQLLNVDTYQISDYN